MHRCLLFLLLSTIGHQLFAQVTPNTAKIDTTENEIETPLRREDLGEQRIKEIDTYADQFVPRKASLYSAILPGLGQAYNKNYWKIPIIYGGFFALGYTINFYDDRYKLLRSELFTALEEGTQTTPLGLTVSQARGEIDDARRERDFYMIMTGVLYLLQIAEAHIDAHLKEFKLNPDLRVKIEPMFEQPQFADYQAGLSLKFRF